MKRFTATEKWDDSWFRKLPPEQKCFWDFICTRCDCAGVWKVDLEAAEFFIGTKLNLDTLLVAFGNRIRILSDEKWWITRFIEFQYGRLSRECKPHGPIFKALEHHGISLESLGDSIVESNSEAEKPETLTKALANPSVRVQEKEKEKEKDPEGGESEGNPRSEPRPDRYSPARIALHWLNEKACRHYRETDSNLKLITCRLEEVKGDLDGVKMMIDRQCARWKGTEHAEYLTPDTLFGKKNFGKYYDNRDIAIVETNGGAGKPNARNFGIAGDQAERARRVAETVARRQREAAEASAQNGVAAAQP